MALISANKLVLRDATNLAYRNAGAKIAMDRQKKTQFNQTWSREDEPDLGFPAAGRETKQIANLVMVWVLGFA